ncbi:MAG: hypothetical protein D6785_02010 [Planctomycetota bacterium]|nr:MAG: hypothetical protein D6785_02010 [Planctomycetota bacterium]
MKKKTTFFTYHFVFGEGKEKEFTVELEKSTFQALPVELENKPEWTKLDFYQCGCCPLTPKETERCPIAINMLPIVEFFDNFESYEKTRVTITSPNRSYFKDTTLQEGISSLIGLIMASSGCPIMDKLRPMAYTHLPFASLDETIFRSISSYLFAQYLLQKKGSSPDLELKGLAQLYENINAVNQGFSKRLLAIQNKDASLNALVRLDCFALSIHSSIMKDALSKLEPIFSAYFEREQGQE